MDSHPPLLILAAVVDSKNTWVVRPRSQFRSWLPLIIFSSAGISMFLRLCLVILGGMEGSVRSLLIPGCSWWVTRVRKGKKTLTRSSLTSFDLRESLWKSSPSPFQTCCQWRFWDPDIPTRNTACSPISDLLLPIDLLHLLCRGCISMAQFTPKIR